MSYAKNAGRSGRVWKRLTRVLKELSQKRDSPCALCGGPIDYTLKWPDPRAFTADHIIPLSTLEYGDPMRQSLSNLQPAHAGCNSSKGNGTRTAKQALKPVQPKRLW